MTIKRISKFSFLFLLLLVLTSFIQSQTVLAQDSGTGTYSITFNTNGGSTVNTETYTAANGLNPLPTPTRTGYIFGGWYSNSNYSDQPITAIAQGTTGDMTLYAYWIKAPVPLFLIWIGAAAVILGIYGTVIYYRKKANA